MPQKKRTNLEVLILALVQRGLETTYDLHMRAEISVGATLPALARLEKAGLVKATRGTRRSRRYELSSAGSTVLNAEVRSIAQEIPADLEGILRVAYLLSLTRPVQFVQAFLRRAAQDRTRMRGDAERKAQALAATPDSLSIHGWMRAAVASKRLAAEARAANQLARLLGRKVRRSKP